MQIITFGCRLNIFESAAMEKLVGADLKDVILFNSCAVTGEAAGIAAAMTDDFGTLDVQKLQEKLVKAGVKLHENEIM